jgi:hypothetical protein
MSENEKERNRAKYRRWNAKHRAEIMAERFTASAVADEPTGRKPTFTVREWIDAATGVPVNVFACRAGDEPAPPPGVLVSWKWLPDVVVSKVVAERIVRLRVEQVRGWCGGQLPVGWVGCNRGAKPVPNRARKHQGAASTA